MKKVLLGLGISLLLSSSFYTPAYAGQWKVDDATQRWKYYRDDNSLPANEWERIDGSLYYFDNSALLLTNTTTPDGYSVDGNGVWRQDVPRVDWQKDENGQNVDLMRYYLVHGIQNDVRRVEYDALRTVLNQYNFGSSSDELLINDYIYLTAIRSSDASGKYLSPVDTKEDPAKYKYYDVSLLRVPVDKDTVGVPEIIFNWGRSHINDGSHRSAVITHAAQGKLCLKYSDNTYGQYDITTGQFSDSSYEQNESMKVPGKYEPEDFHYYEMIDAYDYKTCTIIVRNLKNEIERQFKVEARIPKSIDGYIHNATYYGIKGDNVIISRTAVTNLGDLKGKTIHLGDFGSNVPASAISTSYRFYFNKYNGNFVKYETIQ